MSTISRFISRDLEAVMSQVVGPHCPQPVFALAHSMGAAITFHALDERIVRFERFVAIAPMVRIAFVKARAPARLLMEVLDGLGFGASFIPGGGATSIATKPFPGNRLSTDPVRYARNASIAASAPTSCHRRSDRCLDRCRLPRHGGVRRARALRQPSPRRAW